MERYLKFSPFYFFCLYSILYIIFTLFCNYILYDDAIFYKSFEDTIGIDSINSIIKRQKIIQKFNYGLIPILLFLRAFYTSICLMTGVVVSEQNLKFGQCFNISIKADIIFLFELMLKINYFSIVEANSIQEIDIHFLSILQLIGFNIDIYMTYPLGILNLFELAYWFLLASFFSNYTKKSFWTSLGFVAKTYGIGLLLWILFIMFIILNLFVTIQLL